MGTLVVFISKICMRFILITSLIWLLSVSSCELPVPSFAPERLVEKQIGNDTFLLEWYTYSGNLSQQYPNYVTIYIDNTLDTICIADNVADIKFSDKIITVCFYGRPQRLMNFVILPTYVADYAIHVDSSYRHNFKH